MRNDQPDEADVYSCEARGERESEAGEPEIADARPADARPADQVAERARYRDRVGVRYQEAWAEAVPALRDAWEEHKARYPERTRAAPRTETDGSWTCGAHRRLDPEQNAEASKAHTELADEASRSFLPALRRVEAADPDRGLAGLEHMVKGEDRLKEKLADYLRAPETTVREALEDVPDAVRATLRYDSAHYSDGVLVDIARLKAEGFELIKLKNLWPTEQYKGVNSQWRIPESGQRFEMQFHTPESLEAKELTHEAYEGIRANAALPADEQDPVEERELEKFQQKVNMLIMTPPGTDRIKNFPES